MSLFRPSETVEAHCVVEIEKTAESFHAFAVPEGVDIRPGDSVLIHDAPTYVEFGERIVRECSITVTRAGWLERTWTQIAGMFELTELYEVGFDRKDTP